MLHLLRQEPPIPRFEAHQAHRREAVLLPGRPGGLRLDDSDRRLFAEMRRSVTTWHGRRNRRLKTEQQTSGALEVAHGSGASGAEVMQWVLEAVLDGP